jgi:hypothetical protein
MSKIWPDEAEYEWHLQAVKAACAARGIKIEEGEAQNLAAALLVHHKLRRVGRAQGLSSIEEQLEAHGLTLAEVSPVGEA